MSGVLAQRGIDVLRHVGTLCLFLALGLLFYAPPPDWPKSFYFGVGYDPWIFIWFLRWWPFALQHHLPLMYTSYVDAPVGVNLAWKTSLAGLAPPLMPFTSAFGAVAVYNCLMLAAPGLAGWGAYLAAYEMTGRSGPSIVAGLIFGFSNYETSQLLAHLNLAFIVIVPICLWTCLRAARHNWEPLRLGLILGSLLALEFGIAQEVFASSVVFGAMLLVALYVLYPDLHRMAMKLVPGIAIAIAVCSALIAPLLWQMLRWYSAGMGDISSPTSASSDLLGFFVPTPLTMVGGKVFSSVTRMFIGGPEEQGTYFGLPLLALLVVIWRANRSNPAYHITGVMAVLAGLCSLGPYVHILGVTVSTAPWIAVQSLPFLKAMLPVRFMLYSWLAVALMIALWLAAHGAPRRRYLAVACCLVFVIPDPGFARRWTPIHVPDVFTASPKQQTIPHGSHILILPELGEALSYQAASGMDFYLVGQGYLGSGEPRPFSQWQFYQSLFDSDFVQIDATQFAAYLAAYGVDHVVVLQGPFVERVAGGSMSKSSEAAALLRRAGWEIEFVTPDAMVFRPGPSNATAPTADEIAHFMSMPSERRMAKLIKSETQWVCGIRTLARYVRLDPERLLVLYATHANAPLPAANISCK